AEMARRRILEGVLRRGAEAWGYQEVATPLFEELELFTERSGEEIVRGLYDFTDKGGRRLCLRPELTAPTIRMVLGEMSRAPKPLRLYYLGPCYRYEEPQKNRYREFTQFGVEVIGADPREAEAEILGLAGAMLEAAGVPSGKEGGARIRLGHVGFLRHCLKGLPEERRARVFKALDKKQFKLAGEEWKPALAFEAARSFADLEKTLGPNPHTGEIRALREALEPYGVPVEEDPSIVRGLDYYTGPVFEVHVDRLGGQSQVCGGGTYTLRVEGREVTSTGFAFGFDRLLEAARLPPVPSLLVAVVSTPEVRREALRVAGRLRAHVPVLVDINHRPLKAQLGHAHGRGATHAVVLGPREAASGRVTLRDMGGKSQEEMDLEECIRRLGSPRRDSGR
ncbi:MAG: histidine--tRNA ligase, partial [Euryarchaeota archaeon]|nr:histidine--tRNA ligase [Euryarchaeota archaeon]